MVTTVGGLGPNGSSLLERVGKQFEMTLDWLILDRQERGQARKIATIRYATKHKKQQKPLAPVKESDLKSIPEGNRLWIWQGEVIESKGLQPSLSYSSEYIRKCGFRLPKLKKKVEL